MSEITKETFQEADEKTRLDILFDLQCGTSDDIKEIKDLLQLHPADCEARFKNLENKKVKDTVVSGSLGFVGGFAAMTAKLKFWG